MINWIIRLKLKRKNAKYILKDTNIVTKIRGAWVGAGLRPCYFMRHMQGYNKKLGKGSSTNYVTQS